MGAAHETGTLVTGLLTLAALIIADSERFSRLTLPPKVEVFP